MRERLDQVWRVFATALCFSAFGVGGLLIRTVVYPAVTLLIRDPARRSRVSRAVIHHAFRAFVQLMAGVGVIRYEVRGREKLNRDGLLVLANHPSLIDVVLLISLIQQADCIVKGALLRNPFTRGPIRAAGYICNDVGSTLVEACIDSLRAGNNLIIFPEGTRTPLVGQPSFQRGAANVAVRGRIDITPVHIRCDPPVLTKTMAWYHVPRRRPRFVIEVGDDLPIEPHLTQGSDALGARHLTDHLFEYFFPLERARANP